MTQVRVHRGVDETDEGPEAVVAAIVYMAPPSRLAVEGPSKGALTLVCDAAAPVIGGVLHDDLARGARSAGNAASAESGGSGQNTDDVVAANPMAVLRDAPWTTASIGRSTEPRALPVVLSSRDPTGVSEPDTLRFTYHFQSWYGQPTAVVTLGQSEQGNRLRIDAPDEAVFMALVARREALSSVVHINDETRRGRAQDEDPHQESTP